MRRITTVLVIALLSLIAGSSLAGKAAKPSTAPALHGYCPVAYSAMGKAVQGDPHVALVRDGHRYLFTNADARKMFQADPSRYRVAYDGWCATAMSMGQKLESDPAIFTVHDGVTYLFSSTDARKAFGEMPGGVIEKADASWSKRTRARK